MSTRCLCGICSFAQMLTPPYTSILGMGVGLGHTVGRNLCLLGHLPPWVTLRWKPWSGEVADRERQGTSSVVKLLSSHTSRRQPLCNLCRLTLAFTCLFPVPVVTWVAVRLPLDSSLSSPPGWSPSLSVLTWQLTWLRLGTASNCQVSVWRRDICLKLCSCFSIC